MNCQVRQFTEPPLKHLPISTAGSPNILAASYQMATMFSSLTTSGARNKTMSNRIVLGLVYLLAIGVLFADMFIWRA
jgi:hypothetical protein